MFDLSDLPAWLQRRARVMSVGVRLYEADPEALIVSSFFEAPVKPHRKGIRVHPVGVMIRPTLKAQAPTREGHVLAYLRKHAYPKVLEGLERCGRPVRVYGLGERPSQGSVEFCKVDAEAFTRDLLSCDALVCNAGNQLLGEASFLDKPTFALPEAMQHEQWINAHYLAKGGGGTWADPGTVTADQILEFLRDTDRYHCHRDPARIDGTEAAIHALEAYLPGGAYASRTTTPTRTARPAAVPRAAHHNPDPERTAL